MNCYEAIDVMGDAVEGRLLDALRPGFEEHLAECASCGTYFQHLRFTRRALQGLPREAATDSSRAQLVARYRREFGPKSN